MKNLAQDTRRALRIGTALATGIIGIIQGPAAFAQNIPDNTMPTISNAGGAVLTTVGTIRTVDLTNGGGTTASRNLVWSDFSIGADNTVSFVASGDALTSFTALNNVTNAAPISIIEGNITAQSNVAVWLINPQGMVFSSGSSFSGGSLVLSTLPAVNAGDTTNILDQTGSIDLGQTGGSSSAFPGAITIAAGASIDASLGVGAHVSLISQQIDVSGSITAPGDVGLVLGHAVTLPSSLGSPLGFTITAGTRLANAKLLATGTIDGANVRLAAISDDAVTGALLQVDSSAILTATADGGSVILTASRQNPGSASLVSNGTLDASNVNGSVSITADGAATVTGTVTTAGTGIYEVAADTVTLGGSTARTQLGANGVNITATGGSVTATNALTLISNANISITSDTNNALIHSAVSAGGTYSVSGEAVTLGDGTAALQQAVGAIAITARTGDLTTGTGLSLVSTGGTATLDGSSGNVQIGGRVVANGDVTVTAQDDVRIASYNALGNTGYIRSDAGDVAVNAGGSVYGIGNAAATASILALQSGIDGYAATGSLTVNGTGDVHAATLSAGTDLVLNVTGALLGSAGPTGTNVAGGAIFANGVGGTVTVKATSPNESVALSRVEAASDVTIWGDQIVVGTLKQGGTLDLSDHTGGALAGTDSYIGLLAIAGNYVVNFTDAAVVTNVVATEDISALPIYGPEAFSSAFGRANLIATTGTITGTIGAGAQLGTVTAGGLIDVDAGGIVARSVTSGASVNLTATAGTLSLLDVAAGTTLTLDKQGGLIATAGDDLRVLNGTSGGAIVATSNTSARIGLLAAIIGDISVTTTLGDITGSRTGTAAALGSVTTTNLLSTAYGRSNFTANAGSVSLNAASGGIQAGNINIVGGAGDITVSARALTLDLAVAQRDLSLTATLGTLYLGTGSIGRTALVTKSGGSIATAGDELRIGVLVGGTTTGPGGTTVNSSTHIRANTIDDGQGSVAITTIAGDVVIQNRIFGTTNVDITAGRDFQIANYVAPLASGYVQSLNGNVTINAGRSVYGIGGSATDLPTIARGTDGYAATGNLTVNATGDAYVGTLTAGGNILLNIAGGLFGSNGTPGTNVPGGAVFANGAGGTVIVNANGAGGVNVLNRVEAAGNVTLKGEEIAVGSPVAGGTLSLLDLTNNPLSATNYYIGVTTVVGDYVLNLTDPITITNMIALEDTSGGIGTYAPEFFDNTVGKTDLDAGGRISGTVGNGAQLGTVLAGGFIDLTTGAIVADSVTAGGAINIAANTGTLSLLDVAASGPLTLTKNAGLIGNPGDDLRIVTGTSIGGTTLISNTSIRVGDLLDTTGDIALTATTGDVSGLLLAGHSALPTTSVGTALSTNWAKADLAATLGTITVTAASGAAQLGALSAGTNIVADALALTADTAIANGSIDLAVTGGTLYLGSGTAGLNATLDKTGTDDELRFGTLVTGNTPGGLTANATVTSSTNIRGTTITARSGQIQVQALNGQVTGNGGGRLVLNALGDLDGTPASDLGINVTTGGLARLGNLQAGLDIIVTAGPTNGSIDMLNANSARGDVHVTAINAAPAGTILSFLDISAGAEARMETQGGPGGNIVGRDVTGVTIAVIDAQSGSATARNVVATAGSAGARALAGDVTVNSLVGTTGLVQAIASNDVNASNVQSGTSTLVSAGRDANVTTLTAGTTADINATRDINLGTTSSSGYAHLGAGRDIVSTLLTAVGDVQMTAASNIRAGQVTSSTSTVTLTATNGDISGLLTGAPGVLPTTTSGTQLSSAYGRANLSATTGTITVTAANGGAQLGALAAGTDIIVDALALTADSATAVGLIDLAVTSGTLYLGSGSAGLTASLDKTGAGDELRFGTLVTGTTPGGATADATVRSSTNIRGTSITARSGAILVEALNGQVTGVAGGRLALSALGDLDGTPLSDLGVTVNTGGLARLGNMVAGTNILVNAGNATVTNGAVDMLDANAARGDVTITVNNSGSLPNGIAFGNVIAGGQANLVATGGAGGNITGGDVTGATQAVVDARNGAVSVQTVSAASGFTGARALGGNVNVASVVNTAGFVQVIASNDIFATSIQAGTTVLVDAVRDANILGLTSGGNVDITAGRDAISGTISSGGYAHLGAIRDIAASQLTAASDVQLTAGASIRAGQLTSSTSSVTLAANGGDITGLGGFTSTAANRPDILAASAILITSTGSTQLDTAQAGTSLTVTAGTLTSDGAISINTATAPGAIALDAFASSPAVDANHDGGISVGTVNAGGTLTWHAVPGSATLPLAYRRHPVVTSLSMRPTMRGSRRPPPPIRWQSGRVTRSAD
jgi:filamentous hemagglutinin family protein